MPLQQVYRLKKPASWPDMRAKGDVLDSFGVYGCNPSVDVRGQTAQLAADIHLVFFSMAICNRKSDYPGDEKVHYLKYTIHFQGK
jgi:hypothetical protein